MTRREATEKVFNYIRGKKFTPINIEYGRSYFIFDHGEDGIVHFNIKGLHGWKFAMWIETDPAALKNEGYKESPAIQFFCQHELNIDKFKPSRSFFLTDISLHDIEKEDSWYLYNILDILQMIKKHPLVSFAMDGNESAYCNESYLKHYLGARFYGTEKKITTWFKDKSVLLWHGPKVWFINKYKVVDRAKLFDLNKGGWKCRPRYNMRIHFKKLYDDEEKQSKAEIKMLDVFFRKNDYDNMHLQLSREGAEGHYSYKIAD